MSITSRAPRPIHFIEYDEMRNRGLDFEGLEEARTIQQGFYLEPRDRYDFVSKIAASKNDPYKKIAKIIVYNNVSQEMYKFNKMAIQNFQSLLGSVIQLVPSFSHPVVYVFGQRPVMFNFTAIVPDGLKNSNWFESWLSFFSSFQINETAKLSWNILIKFNWNFEIRGHLTDTNFQRDVNLDLGVINFPVLVEKFSIGEKEIYPNPDILVK